MWEKEKLLVMSNFSFPTVFSPSSDNFLPFSSNLKLWSANAFSLEESKIFHLGKGYGSHIHTLLHEMYTSLVTMKV